MKQEFLTETGQVVNLFMLYQFLKRLTTPFDETEAFRLGIIDERGKRTKKPMKTKEEKESWRMFDRLVFRLKMLLEKLPLGRTRLASYAAALLLIKENKNWTLGRYWVDSTRVETLLKENMTLLEENGQGNFRMLRDQLNEDAPTVAVGTGHIAGAAPGEDPPIRRKKKKRKKKVNGVGRKTFLQFGLDEEKIDELAIVKPPTNQILGIPRRKMPQIASKDYPELLRFISDTGASLKNEMISANKLKAVQKDFSDTGIAKSILKGLQGAKKKALIVSKDGFIADGHHRWLATMNTNPDKKIPILRVNIPIKELMKILVSFPKVTFKSIYESVVDDQLSQLNSKLMKVPMKEQPNRGTELYCEEY